MHSLISRKNAHTFPRVRAFSLRGVPTRTQRSLVSGGVAIGSGVGMMSMAALEAEKKDTVAHSVKESSWAASKQVSGAPARGFAAAVGRQ